MREEERERERKKGGGPPLQIVVYAHTHTVNYKQCSLGIKTSKYCEATLTHLLV